MRCVMVAVAAVALAGSAQAQTTNTNCHWIGTQMYCTSTQQPQFDWNAYNRSMQQQNEQMQQNINRAFENARRAKMERQAQREQQAQAYEDQRLQQACQMVADAVSEGNCDEAKQRALGLSDFDLAEQVMRICVPK